MDLELNLNSATIQGPTTDTVKANPKKRKASTNDTAKHAKKSKASPYLGLLKHLLDMPFDILFEIFGHLGLEDLLSLGRTSKEYRNFVKDPQFKCVWAHCRAQYPGSPECPKGISEPMFAELIFGTQCLVCGKTSLDVHTIWAALTRRCTTCIADSFASLTFVKRLNLPTAVCKMVPKIHMRNKDWYSRVYANAWAKEYHALETAEKRKSWEDVKICHSKSGEGNGELYHAFYRTVLSETRNQILGKMDERKMKIVELVKSMGWADELAKMSTNLPQDQSQITTICQEPLTAQTLADAKPILERHMTAAKMQRIGNERGEMLTARLRILKDAYDAAIGPQHATLNGIPSISDVLNIPRIKSLVVDTPADTTVTAADFAMNQDTISAVIEEVREANRSKLIALVRTGLQDEGGLVDPSGTVLDLATTCFLASQFGCTHLISSKTALEHKAPQKYPETGAGSIEAAIYKISRSAPFNTTGALTFDVCGYRALCKILILCGLDPKTTTVDQADEIDPIVECALCNQFDMGRLMMRWRQAGHHLLTNHSSDDGFSQFCLIKGEDAVGTKKALKDVVERRAFNQNVQTKCNHCDQVKDVLNMRRHIYTEHGVIHPTDADWSYVVPLKKEDEHRLWPPRIFSNLDSSC